MWAEFVFFSSQKDNTDTGTTTRGREGMGREGKGKEGKGRGGNCVYSMLTVLAY
jgi:hypothetical protein